MATVFNGKIKRQFKNSKFSKTCINEKPAVDHDWLAIVIILIHPPNFRWLLQLLFFRNTAKRLQVANFYYALSVSANIIFQKRTIFVFSESWSRDQLLQKAYSCPRSRRPFPIISSPLILKPCVTRVTVIVLSVDYENKKLMSSRLNKILLVV